MGVFSTRQKAELALEELRDSGFSMDKVSIIARDGDREKDIANVEVEDHDRVGNKADEGATKGAVTGGVFGGVTGLLVGLGALAIPGIGPIMLAGVEATALATALAGGAIGAAAGGLVGGLVGLGIPEERAKVYNDRVTQGDYLVIVDGTEAEINRAHTILQGHNIEEYGVYDVPNNNTVGNTAGVPSGERLDERLDRPADLNTNPATASNISTDTALVNNDVPVGNRAEAPLGDRLNERLDRQVDPDMNPVPANDVRTDTALTDKAIVNDDFNRENRVDSIPDQEPEVIVIDHRDESTRSV
ncbi:MAG: general stress protein [Waterburya sp.]